MDSLESQMRDAAQAAAALVEPGMRVGLGTGRTVAWLLQALGERRVERVRCVSTSPETERVAQSLGIEVEPFDQLERLDIAIDGADQVTPDRWAVKGGHGAHVREKIVASAADRFVVIVTPDKLVDALHPPVPLELVAFGVSSTLRNLGEAKLRADAPTSPDGGVIADYTGEFDDPDALAMRLSGVAGVVGHGLFEPSLIADVIVGGGAG